MAEEKEPKLKKNAFKDPVVGPSEEYDKPKVEAKTTVDFEDPEEDDVSEAADILVKAEEIKRNPKLMKAVKERLQYTKQDIKTVEDIKKRKQELEQDEEG